MQYAKLILVRGHPGSGKTTFAQILQERIGGKLVSTDDQFMKNGRYEFDPKLLPTNHRIARSMTRILLRDPNCEHVIVHNTFTKLWELNQYIEIAEQENADFMVFRCLGDFKNVHGVPEKTVTRMKNKYEPYPNEIIVNEQAHQN